ncbi:hypothetical protein B0H16DRAFT_1506984 [Mycena metata]|uniref:MYND-type domain-containing protein n=1 Tax=Mycena metata TaxID=1033252 RepID=A0AAD7K286_9AGAR|nr:hypothetical protein B0H16DRAFT_1506984 [Mycena metata]
MPPQLTEMCENCTEYRTDLRRCSGCGIVRYCSKECQKAHWKEHKPHCVLNAEMAKKSEDLGSDYSIRLKAIGKWCDAFSIPIGIASASALDIMNHPGHLDEFVLVIYVDFIPGAKPPYTFDVVDAEIIPLDILRARALQVSQQQLELFERNLAPRPGVLRVLLLDRRFPWSYTTPFVPPRDIAQCLRDPLWFEHLQMFVTHPGHPVRPRERAPMPDIDLLDARLKHFA